MEALMKRSTLSVLVATLLLANLPSPSVAATEIQFWHAMTGSVGERVNDIAAKFTASQRDYVVKAGSQGDVSANLQRRRRGVSGEAATAHRPGLRARHTGHAIVGHGLPGVSAHEG
jgi:ABC-type glycerol-3-phosphate transport system substrate-binding protein